METLRQLCKKVDQEVETLISQKFRKILEPLLKSFNEFENYGG